MKPRNSSAYGLNRINAQQCAGIGLYEASDRLYWTHAADCLFTVRPSSRGRFVYEAINPALETLLGMSSEEIRETEIRDCLCREDARSIRDVLDGCLDKGTEVRIRQHLSFGHQLRDVETVVSPIYDPTTGKIVRLIGCHRTLSESDRECDSELYADTDAKLLSIQEGIQQRIASDLHDSTCQHLIAASLSVMRIRAILRDPAGADRVCDEIDTSIDRALKEIRAFAYLLHPQDLTVDGIKATIEQYAGSFAARTSLKVATEISSEIDRLPHEKQHSLLRIVQEALTNVFRHAKATEVEIKIDAKSGQFRLKISDNGRGMPVSRARRGARATYPGVGIPAMQVRLRQLGGRLEIQSAPEAGRPGTTLCAVFPDESARKQRSRFQNRVRHNGAHQHVVMQGS
ncbi:ATP-binding protein [Bradyrhizobium sp. STM 3562]|uniref:sensor histidine kinase n=1 Tax=Bradyrhizobium sp. STM 3562 TaxID=578924 RepID=UPI00388D138A